MYTYQISGFNTFNFSLPQSWIMETRPQVIKNQGRIFAIPVT